MTVQLRVAQLADLDDLAATLGRAFVDDSILRWPLGSADDIHDRIIATFRHLDAGCVGSEMLWQATDHTGAALWVSPDNREQFAEIERASRPAIHALTDDGGERYDLLWDWIDSMLPEEPMWFLDHVGVEPASQGRGIGAALIGHGLANARAQGVCAFLETSKVANIAYYERLGFHVVTEGAAPAGGPHIWFLRCDPS